MKIKPLEQLFRRFKKNGEEKGVDEPDPRAAFLPQSLQEQEHHAALLWAPVCDEVTSVMAGWLDTMPTSAYIVRHTAIGKSITREDIIRTLNETNHLKRVTIFAGHGDSDALLGAPHRDCISTIVDGKRFAIVYDATLTETGPSALYAFCCKAAQILGVRFTNYPERTFLGYEKNIGYDLDNEECQGIWKKIIQTISGKIINDGVILEEHETLLKQLYDDALDYFRNGPGKENDRALESVILLRRHKKYLRRFGGC